MSLPPPKPHQVFFSSHLCRQNRRYMKGSPRNARTGCSLPTCTPVVHHLHPGRLMLLKASARSLRSSLPCLQGQAEGTRLPPPAWIAAFHHAWPSRCGPRVRLISGPFLQAPASKEEKKTSSREQPWSPQRPSAPSQTLAQLHPLGQDSV